MPISGPSSYVPTTAAFLAHWAEVNAALPVPKPLVLSDETDRAGFEERRAALLTQRDKVEDADLEAEEARGILFAAKQGMLVKINLFNTKVRAAMGGGVYARLLPLVPQISLGQEDFLRPMSKAKKLWVKINAAPPPGVTVPLELADGTLVAAFAVLVEELASFYDRVEETEQDFSIELGKRDDLQDELYELMKLYRVAVPGRFLAGNALVESLPALTVESSRTPDPVSLTGEWVPADAAARLQGGVSNDPDLKEYELRWCAGASYSTNTEHVVGSVPAGTVPVFVTTKGLTVAGAVASFRVYVRLLSGGEAGSDTVVVTRT